MSVSYAPKIAVIGASGIGKFHANWWTLEGANVVAFVGTGAASVEATTVVLRKLFGFAGRGYTSLTELLEKERPDLVDVCSPSACHYAHVKEALAFGCDVLCEKPFLFDVSLGYPELREQAAELVELARAGGRTLGLCTQHYVASRICMELCRERDPGFAPSRYRVYLASPALGRPPDPVSLWVDLSPHLIGAVQAVAPAGRPDWTTLRTEFEGDVTRAVFEFECGQGRRMSCDLMAGRRREEPLHARDFELDSQRFVFEGMRGDDGVFCARIVSPTGALQRPDMMHLLIREYLAGKPPVDAAAAQQNLEWMLEILDRAGVV